MENILIKFIKNSFLGLVVLVAAHANRSYAQVQTPSVQLMLAWNHSNAPQEYLSYFKIFYGLRSRNSSPTPETFAYDRQQWVYDSYNSELSAYTGVVSELSFNTKYYFAVSAVGVFGDQGPKSAEISYVTPEQSFPPIVMPQVTNLSLLDSQFSFQYTGGELNRAYRIEASADLKNWETLHTFTVTNLQGVQGFSFAIVPGEPKYFFRIASDP